MVLHFPDGSPWEEADTRNDGPQPEYGDIVLINWLDSCGTVSKWVMPEFSMDYDSSVCSSVAFFVRKDATDVIVAGSHSEQMLGDVNAIPAAAVISMTVLLRGDGRMPKFE